MIRRVGRPGLIGTMARTAVIAGTASAVSGGMQQRGRQRAAEQQAAAQVAAQQSMASGGGPAAGDELIGRLRELAALRSAGVLSDEEFTAAKARLLA